MVVFTVSGETRYGQVLLKTDTLLFQTNSKLVFAPTEKAVPGQKSFTIVAGEIQVTDQAQITYDLDGEPGIDPDTPAPPVPGKATNGSGGSSLSTDGLYPRAEDGGPGQPGTTGAKGIAGFDAPSLEIFVVRVNSSAMEINFKGQDGGKGQAGGDGGPGGAGQKGAASIAKDSWYDGDECTREPGRGGNGGKGGDAGYPGTGGKGGNGGIVKVFADKNSLSLVRAWTYIVNGGKGGNPGIPGQRGDGGVGGPQGDKYNPCPARSEYAGNKGPDGRSMDDIDPDWPKNFTGADGRDGDWAAYELSGLPA